MKIALGCDHGALALKNALIPHLETLGYEVKDFGTYTLDSCDYPDFAAAAAKAVAKGECDRGIVLCTTGIGVSITANKVDGIRCALLSDVMSARMTREHNDTNMMAIMLVSLCSRVIREHNDTNMMAIGAAVVGQMLAFEIIDTWLGTEFSGQARHQRRIDKVMALENA